MFARTYRLLLVTILVVIPQFAWAQKKSISLVRDAETEYIIGTYAAPLFKAAGLDPAAVRIHLVRDSSLNAFVAGGQRIFINTGLIMRSESPNQLTGVIAHETGHIMGGHLARTHDALAKASTSTILSMLLGAVAIASGSGDAGAAIITGGQHITQRQFLNYTRTQESAADQAAVSLLEATKRSGNGLIEFLSVLADQEALLVGRQDPYVRTHPISRERIAQLENRVATTEYGNQTDNAREMAIHQRMVAKLHAFLEPPNRILRKYPATDTSLPARYARAIAHYRIPELDTALAEIGELLADYPDDPFFHELHGQILYENGRIAASVAPYRRAVGVLPNSPLLLTALATSLIATEVPANNLEAIELLEQALRRDPDQGGAWHQLAIAYGRAGELGLSALASAELAFVTGRYGTARQQARRALGKLKRGTPAWLRASDILASSEKRARAAKKR